MLSFLCLLWALILPQLGCLSTFEWSYRDFDRWRTIGQCASTDQSPIDIKASKAEEHLALGPLTFWSARSLAKAMLHRSAHTWEVAWPQDVQSQAKVTFAGQDYFLRSFDFHSPSENTIDGQYFAMEAQFLHVGTHGQLLVLSVVMDAIGEDNPYLDWYIWSKLEQGAAVNVSESVASPYTDFLPEDRSYFQWNGSLTAPPCTTNVTWILLRTPANISQRQLTAYRSKISDMPQNTLHIDTTFLPAGVENWDPTLGINIRPTQPLGQRKVVRYVVADDNRDTDPLKQVNGWYILLLGLAVGIFCLCVGMCIYALTNHSRYSEYGDEDDARTISRTTSINSLIDNAIDEEEVISIFSSGGSGSNTSSYNPL
jgi:carbonic anhydrase